MTAYTDFHYSPTGSGVISGAQVLEQTEQGINGLGQYVQDNVSGAIDTANEALTTAQNADSNATAAINLANSFNAQIIAANQTAGNALTTAQSAQNTANSASSLATTANNNATTALNTANSASAGVTALTGTVNSLGNRMTAAENAINTNAGNITTLQNNLATTNANVTAASNAANAAQATATSAQATATLARNQAYVLRYTGTTITGGGTIAYADIDNTDNIKAGDKIIDISGAIYAIASVDTANETVTVSASEIINLAVLPDLFNSANTWTGNQTYSGVLSLSSSSDVAEQFKQKLPKDVSTSNDAMARVNSLVDSAGHYVVLETLGHWSNYVAKNITLKYKNDSAKQGAVELRLYSDGSGIFYPQSSFECDLGNSYNKWKSLNGINPGALSLPKVDGWNAGQDIDAAGIDTTNWDMSGGNWNELTNNVHDGWVYFAFINCSAGDRISVRYHGTDARYITLGFAALANGYMYCAFPLAKGFKANIAFVTSGTVMAKFIYPCIGNV